MCGRQAPLETPFRPPLTLLGTSFLQVWVSVGPALSLSLSLIPPPPLPPPTAAHLYLHSRSVVQTNTNLQGFSSSSNHQGARITSQQLADGHLTSTVADVTFKQYYLIRYVKYFWDSSYPNYFPEGFAKVLCICILCIDSIFFS